ncbi:MAG: hypothetical protein K0Q95_565 [Bacteroidota bacterium]|jgi:hypothetical protein|nr:hypothetical protein [Bacteroidota bacterium]
MKKLLFFILVFTASFLQSQVSLETLRKDYYRLNTDSSACASLYKKVSLAGVSDNLFMGYKGAITAAMANHVTSKAEKLKLFNSGKKLIEQSVNTDSSDVELRFLRFTIQTNCPKALGYNKQISSDKKFIVSNFDTVKPASLKSKMAEYLVGSKLLTEKEKLIINAGTKK